MMMNDYITVLPHYYYIVFDMEFRICEFDCVASCKVSLPSTVHHSVTTYYICYRSGRLGRSSYMHSALRTSNMPSSPGSDDGSIDDVSADPDESSAKE